MSQASLYEYGVQQGSSPGTYDIKINSGQPKSVDAPTQQLTHGEQFYLNGHAYNYLGGADLGNQEIGFFATTSQGHLVFFSINQLSGNGNRIDGVTLNSGQSYTICFMAGTLISTPDGAVPVETLKPGDLVSTFDGSVRPVRWLGRQTVSTVFADPTRVLPIRIKMGALGNDLPVRDLLVSPDHALLIDEVLVQAGALVNGTTILRESDVPATFMYYHVELDDHSLLLAEGVPAETFIDNVSRLAFDNWEEHQAIYPEGHAIAEMPYPRAASMRQLPISIARRLAALSGAIATAA